MKKAVWLLLLVFSTQYGIINPDLNDDDDWVEIKEDNPSEEWIFFVENKETEKAEEPKPLKRVGFSPTAKRVELPSEEKESLTTSEEFLKYQRELRVKIAKERARTLEPSETRKSMSREQGVEEIIIQCLNVDIFETLRKRKAIADEKQTGCIGLESNNPQESLHAFDRLKKICAIKKLCYYRTQYVKAEGGGPYYKIYEVTDDVQEVSLIQEMDRYFPLFIKVKLDKKKPFSELESAINKLDGLQARNIMLDNYKVRIDAENKRLAQEYKFIPSNETMDTEDAPRSRSGSYHRIPTETTERRSLSDFIKNVFFGCVIS